ncbi:hypothetical protein TSUD_169520 [Trifolium subterraneum]|nr:hypothetical protein TSUD_169520 [Trifolium subterraneum]
MDDSSMVDSSMNDSPINMPLSSKTKKTDETSLIEHPYIRKREFLKNMLSFVVQNFTYLASIVGIISHTTLKDFRDKNFTPICFLILMIHLVYAAIILLLVEDNLDLFVGRNMVSTIFLVLMAFLSSNLMFGILTARDYFAYNIENFPR